MVLSNTSNMLLMCALVLMCFQATQGQDCDFSTDLCGYTVGAAPQLPWEREQDPTGTVIDFISVDLAAPSTIPVATLTSPSYDTQPNFSYRLTFQYQIAGNHTLHVRSAGGGGGGWEHTGDSSGWDLATFVLAPQGDTYNVIIIADVGSSPDLANDVIRVADIQVEPVANDNCAADPCLNDGECYDTGSSRVCVCINGYRGDDCEQDPITTPPTTLPVTTLAPTTMEPTTLEPTTLEPTTLEPTTLEPTTLEPTTLEPTTLEPTTFELTTENILTSELLTTEGLTTAAPTTAEVTTVELLTTAASSTATETDATTGPQTTEPAATTCRDTTTSVTKGLTTANAGTDALTTEAEEPTGTQTEETGTSEPTGTELATTDDSDQPGTTGTDPAATGATTPAEPPTRKQTTDGATADPGTTKPPGDTSQQTDVTTGLIIGLSLALALALILVIFVVVYFCVHREKYGVAAENGTATPMADMKAGSSRNAQVYENPYASAAPPTTERGTQTSLSAINV